MLTLSLDLKPLSYNSFQSNNKQGRRYINDRGRAYLEELNYQLNDFDSQLRIFGSNLIVDREMVNISIFYYYENFFIKSGKKVHKTNGDVDNPNKILIDELFKRVGHDDYLLGRLTCEKIPSDRDHVVIMITKYPIKLSGEFPIPSAIRF